MYLHTNKATHRAANGCESRIAVTSILIQKEGAAADWREKRLQETHTMCAGTRPDADACTMTRWIKEIIEMVVVGKLKKATRKSKRGKRARKLRKGRRRGKASKV
ncbi:uncharacterized protein ASCRUDRAFT_104911 [Ascoidea rubescens DSM 1968]|uniref:Uncharacterized protein n=1 Tax=Ascoidea rubescens DSM 1968 TaxID=1344418 RepID=A0A1D2VS27_9ASCO|nr:hypothetical protein ASCRUDRAFT_104911 [Ascoidea rubescens DSM 1968]ODV64388.1 hypothetical protein ASCRUDRAFT_104911 [Ascoidea rubescens DSM 1968]